METAKVVGGNGTNPRPIHGIETVDALLDLDNQTTQQRAQVVDEQKQLSRERIANPSERTSERELQSKPFSKILRTAGPKTEYDKAGIPTNSSVPKRRGLRFRSVTTPNFSSEQRHPQSRNTRRRSPQSRPRSSRDSRGSRGRQFARQMPRATSNQEGVPRTSSLKKKSLARSSSEHQYGTNVFRVAEVSPRSNSRRWRGDGFRTPRPEEAEEGELDSFFRFMEDCTRAVWVVLKRIPEMISQLPEITMNILKRLIPALRGPRNSLIEGSRKD